MFKKYVDFINESISLAGNDLYKLKIGIYYDQGVESYTITTLINFFQTFFSLSPRILGSENFKMSSFKDMDLIIIPGGSSFNEDLGISIQGKDDIKQWIKQGGRL